MKLVSHRKCKLGEEKWETIDEDVEKFKSVNFIIEIKYPNWMANVVLVEKS